MNKKLIMRFDPKTIEHLGVSLYSKLPTVISELISNSWDADAKSVNINFIDEGGDKEIYYSDDGEGMTFDELNKKFLLIGRNRRVEASEKLTSCGRKVIGKKGLGKLSVFGICREIEMETIRDNLRNKFLMNIDDILKKEGGKYEPKILIKNESTHDLPGTKMILRKIKRKGNFDPDNISISLSKKFLIFNELKVEIKRNNKSAISVTNELKFKGFDPEFNWNFPDEDFVKNYDNAPLIKGKLMTLRTPVKDTEMRGIYLTSRGKIVNTASFFGLRDTDLFHSYITGYLEIDFIDDLEEDLISTDRQSLNWEHDETKALQKYLQKIIKKIGNEWKKKRADKVKDAIKREKSIDIEKWKSKLPLYEKELSEKIINPVLEDPNIPLEESSRIIGGVIEKFENADYKKYASDIAELSTASDIPQLLVLMDGWKIVETKQFSDLARTRIEVIKQFEKLIAGNTKEIPILHDFLKKFSWIIDPRILEFKDEVRYSKLLKEIYPENKLEEKDRRIDFLCSNALGNILYVVEIKRSKYKIDEKSLEQAYDYGVFLNEKYASQSGFSKVVCYVIGGEKSSSSKYRAKEKTYSSSGEVFSKTYTELFEQAKEFHREFIEKFDELSK